MNHYWCDGDITNRSKRTIRMNAFNENAVNLGVNARLLELKQASELHKLGKFGGSDVNEYDNPENTEHSKKPSKVSSNKKEGK